MATFGVEGVRAADEELGPALHDGGDPDVVLAIILEGKNQSISMLETGKTNAGVFSNDKNMGSDSGHALSRGKTNRFFISANSKAGKSTRGQFQSDA